MREYVLPQLEACRVTVEPTMYSSPSDGHCGLFQIAFKGAVFNVISSDGRGWKESGLGGMPWEHVSVTLQRHQRCPTWEEMSYIKSLFFDDEETVIQFHPPKSLYKNLHNYCLHLWRPKEIDIPLPPLATV